MHLNIIKWRNSSVTNRLAFLSGEMLNERLGRLSRRPGRKIDFLALEKRTFALKEPKEACQSNEEKVLLEQISLSEKVGKFIR